MKVYLSEAKKIKENFPDFRNWELAMIKKYGTHILAKTDEIWNLILEKEKEIINQDSFKMDAKELKANLKDFYKWRSELTKKYGSGISNHLYGVWANIDLTKSEELKRTSKFNENQNNYLKDDEEFLNKLIFWSKTISIILLFFSLFQLPIGFYTLLRFVVCGTAGFSAYKYFIANKTGWSVINGFIALIFNPIIPIYLGKKSVWSVIDITVAFLFIVSIILFKEFRYRESV